LPTHAFAKVSQSGSNFYSGDFAMTTDIRLDQGDGTFVEVMARVVKVLGSDLMLDEASRRHGGGPHRRALVHDQNDSLTLNFNGDYPGGLNLIGVNTMQVRGDITFGMPGITQQGDQTLIPVSLTKEISELQAQINALVAKIAALEAQR
jgi:hypothetical protein